MIQEIAPHCFHNEYRPQRPDRDSVLLCYRGREVLLGRDGKGEIRFPLFGELEGSVEGLYEDYTYLFTLDEIRFYLGKEAWAGGLSGYGWEKTEVFRTAAPGYLAFAGITGAQLCRWYDSHRFCGRCGRPMRADEKERMM